MRNFKLTLCYDGSRYRGWQKQSSTDNTIQGKLEALLSRLLEQPVELSGSGRTDAGVHARAQVCSFRADTDMDCKALLALIRRFLPEDIGALALEEAPQRFHARLSCREKTYVYRIWNSGEPNVFERNYLYRLETPLDTEAMSRAARQLLGRHDFSSFCGMKMKKSAVRELREAEISRIGSELRIRLTGDGFLYNMVRIIVGTLIEVGRGERKPEDMEAILDARSRPKAGFTAPAKGLILWEVRYSQGEVIGKSE